MSYGIDAPKVIRNLALSALGHLIAAILTLIFLIPPFPIIGWILFSAFLLGFVCYLIPVIWMLYSSLIGKRKLLTKLVDRLDLKGDENVLDAGCGKGLLLIMLAKKLDKGLAFGVDIWSKEDQTGNEMAQTLINASKANVGDKVQVRTGNLTHLPYPDAYFDLVASSLVLHNIPDRNKALDEIARVLKPEGRLLLLDFAHSQANQAYLQSIGIQTTLSKRHWQIFPPVRIIQIAIN